MLCLYVHLFKILETKSESYLSFERIFENCGGGEKKERNQRIGLV